MASEISLKDQLSVLPTLVGDENYPMWSRRITAFLKHRELFKTVTEDPGAAPTSVVKKKLSEAANILLTKIGDKLYNRIITDANDNNGFLIWTRIKDLFSKRTGLCLSHCLTQWHRLRYDGNLTDYLDQVESCLAAFDSISYVQDGSAICGVITSALSEQCGSLTDPILTNDALMNDPVLLLTKLCDIAFNERTRKKPAHSETPATAMSTNPCPRTRTGCRGKKHNPAAKTHTEENCWAIYPEKKVQYLAAQQHTTTATPSQSSSSSQHQVPAFAAVTTAQCHLTRPPGITTVLDSGASHHMFNRLDFFEDTEMCSIPISTGQNSTDLSAICSGTAVIAQSDWRILCLPDSLFVPGLSHNLLSLTKLVKQSALITREDHLTRVTIDNSIVFACHHRNDILEVIGEIGPVPNKVFALISTTHSSPSTTFNTWHQRLGHAGIARLCSVLPDIKLEKTGSCDSCMKGKVSRVPYTGHFDTTHQTLEVIHGDLVGPITPSTNSGARYFITLVDQHTGFISVTLLKRKSEATEAILDFKTFFEKQTGFPMKKLITDGGGEFCNNTLSNVLKAQGIQHNVSPPYTPQHNGIAERANKTIINMARCMLVQSCLAKEWWGEAVWTAALTTNCLPSLSKSCFSPLEQLMKKVPNMAFFRPFGCKTWVIKPTEKRTSKFDAIAWDAILLPDFLPHSSLPDFLATAGLPFDDDDEDHLPAPARSLHEDEVMDKAFPDHKDEVMDREEDDCIVNDQEQPNGGPVRQRLILCLGPHPTQVNSDINPSNILVCRTQGAVAVSVLSS
ncbi:hypothetical protein PCASD_09337 [Puccinia coronata f. sp. avenae]|uniref:Integrase catalytic domain-containing protein n=1 Tax=Puccinia coronata f. sp. avenae TaxID=200324 RepID=A0A2N5USK9_9BASI|nr:hypothetical protein PCASD_09337 [Puccinia coronata f. sp. avenae]